MELVKKIVDGEEYQFEKLGAKESVRTMMKLAKLIGRPFILSLGAYKGMGGGLNAGLLAEACGALFNSLDENEALEIIEKLTAGPDKVLCNGKKFVFDSHYEGKLDHLFRVLGAALEVQYGNFYAALVEFISPEANPLSGALTRVK